jgi:hypothetical protein
MRPSLSSASIAERRCLKKAARWPRQEARTRRISKRGLIQLSGGVGLDGLAIEDGDSIAIGHVGLGTTWLFSALGLKLRIRFQNCVRPRTAPLVDRTAALYSSRN